MPVIIVDSVAFTKQSIVVSNVFKCWQRTLPKTQIMRSAVFVLLWSSSISLTNEAKTSGVWNVALNKPAYHTGF